MWQEDLVRELKKARHGEKDAVILNYALATGSSPRTVRRVAKDFGYDAGRRERSDKGIPKTGLTEDQLEYIAALIYTSRREKKGAIMPVWRAIEIAVDNGIIAKGQASDDTVSRLLRERQLSAAHMDEAIPHVAMRSLHPNHVHLVDVSVCIQFYLANGNTCIMDEREFYKNKPHNFLKVKRRLLRYMLVDHFSGAFFLKYYNAAGESQLLLFDFLLEGWGLKGNPEKYPFRGVPKILLMDAGSANTSKAVLKFLERLGVEVPPPTVHNPRRNGAVEVHHNIVERAFESGLRSCPARSIEELNEFAADYIPYFQATRRHTRHGMTRTACWMMITEDQLIELPPRELLNDLFSNPSKECTVAGDKSISFRGKQFKLAHIPGIFVRAKVEAVLKPFSWPVIDVVFQDRRYECQPLEMLAPELGGFRADAAIIGQEYKAQSETLTQQAAKRMENIAYGEEKSKRNPQPFAGARIFGHHTEKLGNVTFLAKKGTAIELNGAAEQAPVEISITEFLKRLRDAIGQITPEMNRRLRAELGGTVEAKRAENIITAIVEGRSWDETAPEAAAL